MTMDRERAGPELATVPSEHSNDTHSRADVMADHNTELSPTDRVLNITELLENILINLDFKTLLFAQRVSRKWLDVIGSHVPLQKKLFMTAVETFEEAEELGMVEEEDLRILCVDECGWLRNISEAVLNRHVLDIVKKNGEEGGLYFVGRLSKRLRPNAFSTRHVTASWERMILFQPPDYDTFNVEIWPLEKAGLEANNVRTFSFEYGFRDDESRLSLIMKDAEDYIHDERGYSVNWQQTTFTLFGWSMKHREWKEQGLDTKPGAYIDDDGVHSDDGG